MVQDGKLARGGRNLTVNRKAAHDYFVLEKIEAGIELVGTEVKVIRNGEAGLSGRAPAGGARDGHALLECVLGPGGVVPGGGGLAQESAQVDEVFVAGAALGELGPRPLGDEPGGSQRPRCRLICHAGDYARGGEKVQGGRES